MSKKDKNKNKNSKPEEKAPKNEDKKPKEEDKKKVTEEKEQKGEKVEKEEEKFEEKKPEEGKKEEGLEESGGGNLAIFAVIVVIILIIWMIHSGSKKPQPQPPPKPVTTVTKTIGEASSPQKPLAYPEDAINAVKESKDPKTGLNVLARLNELRTKKERQAHIKIVEKDWKARDTKESGIENRYFEVTYKWEENGEPVVFMWRVDMEAHQVTPLNEEAKSLDNFEETMNNVGVPTPSPSPKEEASPTPKPQASPKKEEVTPTPSPKKEIKSLKGEKEIDILPPKTPEEEATKEKTTEKAEKSPAPPSPPAIEYGAEFYQLTGVMKTGAKYQAMLKKEGKVIYATTGTTLPDGWVVETVKSRSVTLRKGNQRRTLQLKEMEAPKPPQYEKSKYPKAKPKGEKVEGPPPVPAPGEAPPVPPAPNKTEKKSPEEEPTVIPIE